MYGRSNLRKTITVLTTVCALMSGCASTTPPAASRAEATWVPMGDSINSRVLVMGDSMLSWNRIVGRSVGQNLKRKYKLDITDHSFSGAKYLPLNPLMDIDLQYKKGEWDWVILNGGGNDLFWTCGCVLCDSILNNLISSDGMSGAIPKAINRARADNARVIYVSYLHSPGVFSVVDHCKKLGSELERRVRNLASMDAGIYLLRGSELVEYGDTSLLSFDRVHPSVRGSQLIAERIYRIILGGKA